MITCEFLHKLVDSMTHSKKTLGDWTGTNCIIIPFEYEFEYPDSEADDQHKVTATVPNHLKIHCLKVFHLCYNPAC